MDETTPRAAPAATVRLGEDTEWINECFPLGRRHMHVSVYLVGAASGNIAIDTGSFHHRESIAARLHAATEGSGLQALILSHSDYPHSGNVAAFRREWGDIEIVASSGAPEIQGLPYATKSTLGESMAVRGREFSFLNPPLADRSHTSWVYDHFSRILYTADGFGCTHEPGRCRWTSADYPDGIPGEGIHAYHRDALPWLRYVDPPKLMATLEGIFRRHEVRFVAPIHGSPIAAPDIPRYLERLGKAVARIAAEYRVPDTPRKGVDS